MCLWGVSKVFLEDPPPKKKKKKKTKEKKEKKKKGEEEPKPNYILADSSLNLVPVVSWHRSAMPPILFHNPATAIISFTINTTLSDTLVHIWALHNFQPQRICSQPSCQLITNGLKHHLHQFSFTTDCRNITVTRIVSINNSCTLTA